jgi:hypothetical protein
MGDNVNTINNNGHRTSRFATSLILVLATLLTGAAAQASPAAAAGPCPITPFGGIGEYWQQMGGQGFIGCPVDGKEDPLGSARVRTFEHGKIAWFPFPDHRPFLLSLKQWPGEPLTVNWWDDYNQGSYLLTIDPAPGQPRAAGDRGAQFWDRFEHGTTATANLRPGVAYVVRIAGSNESRTVLYGSLGPVTIVGAARA